MSNGMKIIVGLGNPGQQYKNNRHNAGFMAVDFYLENKPAIACQSKFEAEICELHENGQKIFFVKPQTFMNESGKAIKELVDFYKINVATDLLVIHDDVDLQFGELRTTNDSSSAGHNGVQSIMDELGTQQFNRLRIGVETRESREHMPTESFVLQNFTEQELQKLDNEILPEVSKEIDKFLGN